MPRARAAAWSRSRPEVSSPRRQWLSTLLLLLVLVSVRAVAAERSKVVLLEAHGNPVDLEALRTSLEDWLRSMQLELHLVGVLPPEAEPCFARVRVAWTDETCVVEVFAPDGVLRRRKALPRGGPALLVSESAALIAQAGVQELSIEESRRRPLPVPVIQQVEKPPEVLGEQPPFGLGLAAFVQGRGYGAAGPFLLGGGAEVSATFGDGPWHPELSLLLAYQGPVTEQGTYASVQLQTVSLRLLPSVRRKLGPFEVEFGLGGGLDALIAKTSTTLVSGPRQRTDRLDAAPFFTAAVGLRFHVTPASALFLRAVVDLDPARRRYVSVVADEREYLLVPWLARPALQLGFSFDVLSRAERAP